VELGAAADRGNLDPDTPKSRHVTGMLLSSRPLLVFVVERDEA
jgi:hypothetical protein